ncbi:MAG TPA: hypothetical protein VLS90_20670, partial [Thermodesulfobacteriota bacterium]|nr:hypothetical protein [Thermodesulfobacteriota bacterium]
MNRSAFLCSAVAALLGLFCAASPAHAEKSWAGGTGFWDDPNAWTPAGVPGANENIRLSQSDGANRTVTAAGSPYLLGSVVIDSTGSGVMTLSQTGGDLNFAGPDFTVGYA